MVCIRSREVALTGEHFSSVRVGGDKVPDRVVARVTTYVDFVREGVMGSSAARPNARWRRLAEQRASASRSTSHSATLLPPLNGLIKTS